MLKDLVSVIVPTHNRADILEMALQSVINQTYKNWEIIIVADACTDNTKEILDKYEKYENVHAFESTVSLGGAEARNYGLSKAKGEYIAFLDDDDEWLPEKLEKQVNMIQSGKFAIVGCNYLLVGKDYSKKVSGHGVYNLKELHISNFIGSFSFALTKAEYLKDIFINPALKACQDWDLWVKILSKNPLEAIVLDDVLVRYSNDDSRPRLTTHRKNPAYSLVNFYRVMWDSLSKSERLYALETVKRIRLSSKRGAGVLSNFYFQFNFLKFRIKRFKSWLNFVLRHPIFYRKIKNMTYYFKKTK